MRRKKGAIRIEGLKSILLKLPQEAGVKNLEFLDKINSVLEELERASFIDLSKQPGFGDPSYNRPHYGMPPSPSRKQIKKYGTELSVEPCYGTTKWQWQLIKKAIVKIGFEYSGYGQRSWFLIFHPSNFK